MEPDPQTGGHNWSIFGAEVRPIALSQSDHLRALGTADTIVAKPNPLPPKSLSCGFDSESQFGQSRKQFTSILIVKHDSCKQQNESHACETGGDRRRHRKSSLCGLPKLDCCSRGSQGKS
jgi:hypothetical protein